MSETLIQRLAAYVCTERFENLDPAAVFRAKQILGYHLALAFRALDEGAPDALAAIEIANELSDGGGASTLIAQPGKVTLADAAFANCTLMRALGLDDVIFPAGIHAGLMTLPVALGIGERHRASGADLITALVVGYELLGKFGQFSWAFAVPRRPTMPFGAFGGLATAAKLLGLSREQTLVALAYAAHAAMGLAESDLGPVTHYYSLVCRNAIIGAYAAKASAWGSPTVLEGRHGFFDTFLGPAEIDADALIASLGREYAVLQSCEKRYPGTALNQVPIELMRTLIQEQGLCARDIRRIRFSFAAQRRNFAAGHELGPFADRALAISSVAFQCAILLLDGEQLPHRYDDFANPEIQAVVDKMSVGFVAGKTLRHTRIELITNDGATHVLQGDDFKFEPGRTEQVLGEAARNILPCAQIEQLVHLVDNLEQVDDLSDLMRCLAPP